MVLIILTPDQKIAATSRTIARRIERNWGRIHVIGPEEVSADITAMDTHNQRLDALLRAAITQDEALIRAIQHDIVTNYTRDRTERRTYLKYSSILQNIAPAALWAPIAEDNMAFVGTAEKASEKAWNDGVKRGMEQGMERRRGARTCADDACVNP